ncbi:hypothetical protein [Micromonospora globispora]|uniref:hypothetical protein n=1 Tax=Micromonospora globispora TaxID=1450148 RepID=UPI000F4EE9B0|nr:hypothetical protein [Micromonospora globispora]
MDWKQIAAGLIGIIVGVIAKAVADWIGQGRREKHERRMRLLDRKLEVSAHFVGAAERLWRSESGRLTAAYSLDNSRSSGGEMYETHLAKYKDAVEAAKIPWADAHTALSAVRLLIPEAGPQCEEYFVLCRDVEFPDKTKDKRECGRLEAEKALRAAMR